MNNYCCVSFEEATREGSDNEGYGCAIGSSFDEHTGEPSFKPPYYLGCVNAFINYCPYCGAKL